MIKLTPHPAWAKVLGARNIEQAMLFVVHILTDVINTSYADHTDEDKSDYNNIGITLSTQNRLPEILETLELMNKNPTFEDDPLDEFITIENLSDIPFSRQAKAIAAYTLRDLARQLKFMADEITYENKLTVKPTDT